MPVKWTGPKPPAGHKFCGWCSAIAKGTLATEHKTAIDAASKANGDSPELHLELPPDLPLAVLQTVVLMPLPPNAASMPGMPPAIPVVLDVCWDCANGLTVSLTPRSSLTIPGPGVRVIERPEFMG